MSKSQYKSSFTIEDMLNAYVHFGHRINARNPKMSHNIYKEVNGIHVIDIRKSFIAMSNALDRIFNDARQRKTILFVSTNPKFKDYIVELAERSGQYYVCQWCCGMLTNWRTIVASIKTLKKYNEMINKNDKQEDESLKMTKKELGVLVKKRNALHKKFGGITNIPGIPDLIVVMSAKDDEIAIKEAACVGVPVVAVVDTNASTDNIAYPIPGNDDAIRSIRFYCDTILDAVLSGVKEDIVESRGIVKDNSKIVKEAMERKNTSNNTVVKKEDNGIIESTVEISNG